MPYGPCRRRAHQGQVLVAVAVHVGEGDLAAVLQVALARRRRPRWRRGRGGRRRRRTPGSPALVAAGVDHDLGGAVTVDVSDDASGLRSLVTEIVRWLRAGLEALPAREQHPEPVRISPSGCHHAHVRDEVVMAVAVDVAAVELVVELVPRAVRYHCAGSGEPLIGAERHLDVGPGVGPGVGRQHQVLASVAVGIGHQGVGAAQGLVRRPADIVVGAVGVQRADLAALVAEKVVEDHDLLLVAAVHVADDREPAAAGGLDRGREGGPVGGEQIVADPAATAVVVPAQQHVAPAVAVEVPGDRRPAGCSGPAAPPGSPPSSRQSLIQASTANAPATSTRATAAATMAGTTYFRPRRRGRTTVRAPCSAPAPAPGPAPGPATTGAARGTSTAVSSPRASSARSVRKSAAEP